MKTLVVLHANVQMLVPTQGLVTSLYIRNLLTVVVPVKEVVLNR
jgi:hypothetical protein